MEAKASKLKLTYQSMTDQLGFKSKGYLQKIFTGIKTLSPKSSENIIPLLQLSEHETSYFTLLIQLKSAKNDSEKTNALEKVEALINPEACVLERHKLSYLKYWYHAAIRELVCYADFNENYQKLGRMLSPSITAREAHDSVRLLLNLNLIVKKGTRYTQTNTLVLANTEHDHVAMRSAIKDMIDHGKRAVDTYSKEERHVLSFTAGVSDEGYDEIQEALDVFKKTVSSIVKKNQNVKQTCQLNIQLFPLSKNNLF